MNDLSEKVNKYGPEWIILILITRNNVGDVEKILDIIQTNKINWGEIIEQAIEHKILPMLCYIFISNQNLYDSLPPWINQYVRWIYDLNVHKLGLLKSKAIELTRELEKNNIKYAATKGIILENQIYENKGYRYMSDIDFMIKPEDKNDVIKVLEKLNYKLGRIDWTKNELRELTREEYLKRLFEPNKIPEYGVNTNDDIFKVINVGFVMTFTWKQCEFNDICISTAFQENIKQKIGMENAEVSCLNNIYHYIYIILHLYKHAWAGYFASQNKRSDVNLSRFADIYHFWQKNKDELTQSLPIIMKKYNIEKPVLWVLKNTDIIFESNIVKEINYDNYRVNNLNETKDRKGNILKLKGNIIDRLYSKNRSELIEE